MEQDLSWIWKSPKLSKLAILTFKRYIATLYKLSVIDNITFDTIIVGGNTGMLMGRWAQWFFEYIDIERPILLKIAPQRFQPELTETSENFIDNSILTLDVKNQLYDYKINSVGNILFVDDEIYKGTTAEVCISAIKNSLKESTKLDYYIVAEDQGFQSKNYAQNITTHFVPFSKEIEGLNNLITYLTPNEIYSKIAGSISMNGSLDKYVLNILMGLPTRDKKILFDGFDYKINYISELSLNKNKLQKLQNEFETYIKSLITQSILEYNNGQINLEDNSYINEFIIPD